MPQSKDGSGMVWGAEQRLWGVDLASKFPRSSVGCAGQTSPIHGGPSSKLTGLDANIMVPDTTAHIQGSRVHALMGQGCFGSNIKQVVIMLCIICVYHTIRGLIYKTLWRIHMKYLPTIKDLTCKIFQKNLLIYKTWHAPKNFLLYIPNYLGNSSFVVCWSSLLEQQHLSSRQEETG